MLKSHCFHWKIESEYWSFKHFIHPWETISMTALLVLKSFQAQFKAKQGRSTSIQMVCGQLDSTVSALCPSLRHRSPWQHHRSKHLTCILLTWKFTSAAATNRTASSIPTADFHFTTHIEVDLKSEKNLHYFEYHLLQPACCAGPLKILEAFNARLPLLSDR